MNFYSYNFSRKPKDRIPLGAIGSLKGDPEAVDKWLQKSYAKTKRQRKRKKLADSIMSEVATIRINQNERP